MNYPRHIAIIPDGNRTWAKQKGYPKFVGHTKGFERVVEISKYVFENTPIEAITVWGLSTENLKNRTKQELDHLFQIYKNRGENVDNLLYDKKVNFKRIGNSEGLPSDLVEFFVNKQQKHFYSDSEKYYIVAVNYGGRDEIIRGINSLLYDIRRGGLNFADEITEDIFSKYLDLADVPPVDLVIRTKGGVARRLSGFLLWWIGYSELYFTDKYFPDFDINELEKALKWYDSISSERNFGK